MHMEINFIENIFDEWMGKWCVVRGGRICRPKISTHSFRFEIHLSWFSTMAYSNCHYSWIMPHVAQSKFQPSDMLNGKHTVTVQPNMINHQSNLTSSHFIQFDFELLLQENSGHEFAYCEYADIYFFGVSDESKFGMCVTCNVDKYGQLIITMIE